ncbi:type VI secretion system-associated protein TagF [Phyllobacterium sp. YR531]|uniref:type VI secretion system-associated protein TagF n=1 Tax=Phyllobacterium sp. YR531 TaxID=1144343 RepID=UPI00026FBBAE|nr:type VI secretion system-associated protein TagF [Phyllobacterium sp. YR531]EJM97808.1 type VI secretion-associated protein, BMA_A0400 family [Phyllobacterium sp. YR531]
MHSRDTVLAGYFGKIPTKGDFVSRRLDRNVRAQIDQWLQSALKAGQEELAGEWLELYLNAPIWRFYLEAEICGPYPVVGMMIPSVDKAGRYFPFLVAAQIPDFTLSIASIEQTDEWLQSLESLVLSVLDDDFDLDFFDHRLAKIAFNIGSPDQDGDNTGVFAPLAAALTDRSAGPRSVWWTSGSDRRKAGISLYSGWPTANAFATFFTDGSAPANFDDAFERARQSGLSRHNNGMSSESARAGQLSFAARSHRGTLAEQNIESFVFRLDKGLVSLADGTFGLSRSATISRFLLASIDSVPLPDTIDDALQVLQDRLEDAKRALTERLDITVAGPALQAGALSFIFRQNSFGLLVQGNVHCVLLRNDEVIELTDTSLSKRSGSTLQLQFKATSTTVTGQLLPGDRFLLMTANVAQDVLEHENPGTLRDQRVEAIVDRIIDDTLINGAADNLTIVALSVEPPLQ